MFFAEIKTVILMSLFSLPYRFIEQYVEKNALSICIQCGLYSKQKDIPFLTVRYDTVRPELAV